jgi:dipeptidyl aminopeptidase/acylaminoacyl peptidase
LYRRQVDEVPWTRRNAYPHVAPPWFLAADRTGSVIESLRHCRFGALTDVPGYGCLVAVFRGLRVGLLAVTDEGATFPVTPTDDEASWSVQTGGETDGLTLIRTALDGSRSTASWTPTGGLTWPPLAEATVDPAPQDLAIRRISWPAPGGTLEGLIATPNGEGPFPLVVYLHGGPWFGLRVGDVGDTAFWTGRGAAYLQSDYAGSGILGEAMMWEPLRAVGMPDRDLDADGVLAGVAALVAAGVADPDRLYVYGFSAGGYLVNRIITRPHPFAAAASWESTADVRIFDGETHQLQVFFRGCAPSDCPQRWDAASPITRPEKVNVPFTIIGGGGPTTHRAASTAWNRALTEIGVPNDLHIYSDEEHVFTQQAHQSVLAVLAAGWNLPNPATNSSTNSVS